MRTDNALLYSSHHFSLKLVLFTTIFCSLLFITLPEIDLLFTGLFFEGENNFLLRNSSIHNFMDAWVRPSIKYLVMILAALTALSILSNGQYIGWSIRNIVFIVSTFSLGPGLIVNGLLKEFIGRARPKNIVEFGGDKIFSSAYFPSDQCAHNCSFVSGDVAFAFATIAFPLLLSGMKKKVSGMKKKVGILISIVFGMSIAFYRLGTGAHFFSDTVLAGLLSVITALFCYIIIIENHH